jgi:hypothetical protein
VSAPDVAGLVAALFSLGTFSALALLRGGHGTPPRREVIVRPIERYGRRRLTAPPGRWHG